MAMSLLFRFHADLCDSLPDGENTLVFKAFETEVILSGSNNLESRACSANQGEGEMTQGLCFSNRRRLRDIKRRGTLSGSIRNWGQLTQSF